MSELSTLALANAGDAREIAEMSRDLIEQGLTWSWTPARVQHFISGAESSVVVARRERCGDAGLGEAPRGGDRRGADWRVAPHVPTRRVAAFAIMHFGTDVAHLNLLAVAPEHRRQGLGRQLMDWLTATAIEAGVFHINLELRTQNGQAREFYEHLGFVSRGVVQGYYQGREAALRMSRRLAKNQC
ncbi:MAG TPA: GNAT family N-acetyltransferase [Steroidobacteraceae bacterium]|nr:GNAT family N-acetyltransferase [Steroidobacteraceae bacterium]